MPGRSQPETPFPVHLGGGHREFAAVPGFRRDEIEPGDDVERVDQRLGDPADFGAQPPQDAFDFAVFFAFQMDSIGAQIRDRRRFDERRFAGAAHAVDGAGDFVPVVHRHGQHVVIAVHRGIRIAEDLPEFRVAQQPFDFGFHLLVEFEQLLPHGREFPTGDVEDVPAAVDASADGPRDGAEIFDARQQLIQPVEPFVEPHAVAVDRAGAAQRFGDFEQLLGAQHRADAGPAHDQPHIVQAPERRWLLEFERQHHL